MLNHTYIARRLVTGRRAIVVGIPLLLLAAAAALRAEVFSLLPGGDARPGTAAEQLGAKTALTREVTIDGRQGTLTVAVSPLGQDEALAALKPLLGDRPVQGAAGGVVFETPNDQGRHTRHFLLSLPPASQSVLFTLQLPPAANRATRNAPTWPDDIPAPPAERIDQVSRVTAGRGEAVTALFSTDAAPLPTFRAYDLDLGRAGWEALDRRDLGGLYRSPDGARLLAVTVRAGVAVGTRGGVYLSPPLPPVGR